MQCVQLHDKKTSSDRLVFNLKAYIFNTARPLAIEHKRIVQVTAVDFHDCNLKACSFSRLPVDTVFPKIRTSCSSEW